MASSQQLQDSAAPELPPRNYETGDEIARGGMGAVRSVFDGNIRRDVAMKVLLEGAGASEGKILRFVNEAQVTGQLEHPSIVPVYELGTDAAGNVFYTMKKVQGTTLKDILQSIAAGNRDAIAEYPLSHLLTVFLKACDAVAFAHSRGVVHRDLKPENIMIGEFGEVLVMDWGLAKVLRTGDGEDRRTAGPQDYGTGLEQGGPPPSHEARGLPAGERRTSNAERRTQKGVAPTANGEPRAVNRAPSSSIDSVRSGESGDILKTMDGQVMGTPQFMAPEQALGKIDAIDARTDIYALGAILYNILALRPPIEGNNVGQVLLKVAKGAITPPTAITGVRDFVEHPSNRAGKPALTARS